MTAKITRGGTQLAIAWGILFERYANWWAQGRTFKSAMTFYPFPTWDSQASGRRKQRKSAEEEAFDAVILQESRFVVLEYKGGFLSLEAKYSLNIRLLLRDLNKKIAKGCRQLARNIGELFGYCSGAKAQGHSDGARHAGHTSDSGAGSGSSLLGH